MTALQDRRIREVIDTLTNARILLDNLMYSEPSISENEYDRLRACYDKICEANDELYKKENHEREEKQKGYPRGC